MLRGIRERFERANQEHSALDTHLGICDPTQCEKARVEMDADRREWRERMHSDECAQGGDCGFCSAAM